MDWKRTPEGMDYVPCDGSDAVQCTIEGLLLAVPASLCRAHQKAFYDTGADVIGPPGSLIEWKHLRPLNEEEQKSSLGP
jgi:hypothetical protein